MFIFFYRHRVPRLPSFPSPFLFPSPIPYSIFRIPRHHASHAQLKVALEDVQVLDEGLKQFMDSDGQTHRSPRAAPLTWRRVSETYLRPLVRTSAVAATCQFLEVLAVAAPHTHLLGLPNRLLLPRTVRHSLVLIMLLPKVK